MVIKHQRYRKVSRLRTEVPKMPFIKKGVPTDLQLMDICSKCKKPKEKCTCKKTISDKKPKEKQN